ncbi:hypothetical protein EMA8858_01529 [Emticicia aquatica]|uniref:Helicase XPB/Ssl2 N-terminal domain-containing protein n=1 Tax=Emticicia aquatica TaxID=1681835 RepID=A0ABN8EUE0_9BACT|nr:hypothetical protein [Emticicia aquatica]CAH0995408.1 hypothetical protein EMA8858_01529 [Emticicia aquatica]
MAKERDIDKIFSDYDAFLASIGLGIAKDNKPKPSTFAKIDDESIALAKALDKGTFKRESFMQGYRKIMLAMYASNAEFMHKNGFTENEMIDLKSNYNKITKSEYAHLVAKIFKNKEIYGFFLSFLAEDVKTVFEALVWKNTVSDEDILKELGIKVINDIEKKTYNNKTYFEQELKKEFLLLAIETETKYNYLSNSYLKTFLLELPIELRLVLKEYYDKPLYYNFVPLIEEPQTNFIANNESEIFINLPNLINYFQQGNIKTSATGKVMSSTLGKIRKSLNINEFYPETAPKEVQQLKTYLLASLVVCENKTKKEANVMGILKKFIEKTYPKKYNSHTHILTNLKGGHHLYNINDIETTFVEIIRQLPTNEWISTQNFLDFISLRSYDFHVATIYEMCNYLTYETGGKFGKEKKQLSKASLKNFVIEPLIKGNLMLWACYGLIEIAYDNVNTEELGKTYFSVYDGIKAIRLTNLGAYILEKTTEYEAPTVKQNYNLSFSTENLIILVEGETSITDNLLANYADKVGSNRYAVSNESFLKNVSNKRELKTKIDIFKQVVNSNLPTNWKSFFAILDKKIDPLTQIEDVLVFKIPSDDPELIKLLIQNPAIKKLLIKAEDYQIIVTKKDYPALRNKLKTYGYLLA